MAVYKEEPYDRYMSGDDSGLEELIRNYRDGLMLYLNGIVRDLAEAEELTEEVFFRIAVKKAVFRGRSSFRTWLWTVGRNLAMDSFRRRRHISDTPPEELELADEEGLERSYLRKEQRILLYKTLSKLSPDHRQVLYLTYLEGFTNAEAAAVMGKSRRQIENLVYRAKGALKRELEKEGITYEDL